MKKYKVSVEWSGYSRGTAIYEVYAEDEEDAREIYWSGRRVSNSINRDDTEREIVEIVEIERMDP